MSVHYLMRRLFFYQKSNHLINNVLIMKKFTFLLLALISSVICGYSQVQVGSGSNISQNLPINPSSYYNYSQSIYLASEINASGNITSIQWYYSGTSDLPKSQELTIYMGYTTKESFSNSYDWEPISNLTQVFLGSISTNASPGWVSIPLDTPFLYNGTGNLVIATDENLAGSDSGVNKFWNTEVAGNRSIGFYSNSANPNPSSPPTAGSTSFMVSYVPSIVFGGLNNSCATPYYFTYSNLTSTGITITWQPSVTIPSGGSDYYVSTSNTRPSASATPTGSIASGTFVNLSNLESSTKYYVWIRNNCGTAVSAWSEMLSFTTACSAIASFSEGFEAPTVVPNLPTCWSKILRGPSLSANAAVRTSASNSNTGVNSVQLANSTSSGSYDIILVSPYLSSLSYGTYRLKFYARAGALGANIDVGTLNSNLADANFNLLEPVVTSTTMTQYVVDFHSYTGSDSYIGLRLNPSTTSATVYIDDIEWQYIPNCPDVSAITVPVVTANSATVNWVSAGGDSFDVAVGPVSTTDPSTLDFVNTIDSFNVISGLADNTTYKVWVRSVCNVGGKGAWIGPVSFVTDCLPVATIVENFDGVTTPSLPTCWTALLRGKGLNAGAYIKTIASNSNSSPNSLVLSNSSSNTSDGYDIIAVSPNLSTLSLGTYRLKFSAKGGGTLNIGTLNTNTAVATFSALESVVTTANYATYTVPFSGYTDTDTHIGIRLSSGAPQVTVYIDDIVWEPIPLCPDVSNIGPSAITPTSATIGWTAGGSESAWEVAIGLSSVVDPSTLTPNPTSNPFYTATELIPSTLYKAWVRSVCGPNRGSWIGPLLFTTDCETVASFSNNFDSTPIATMPTCWTSIKRGSTVGASARIAVFGPNTDAYATNCMEMFSANTKSTDDLILVSPPVSSIELGTYRLRFNVRGKANPTLQIGTLSSNTDAAVFTVLHTVPVAYLDKEYRLDFAALAGSTDHYIGIRLNYPIGQDYKTAYIENIFWEPKPLCADVTNIQIATTTTTSALIGWVPQGSEQDWQVVVGSLSTTDPTTLTPMNTKTNSYDYTGLEPATAYKVWVRSSCPHTVDFPYGEWIGPVSFTTDCIPVTTFFENFDSLPTYPSLLLPPCWNTIIRGTGGVESLIYLASGGKVRSLPNYLQLMTNYNCPVTADIITIGPKVSNLKEGVLTFYAAGNKVIQVGTLNNRSQNAVFTPFVEFQLTGEGTNFPMRTVDFSNYTGTDEYIGFRLKLDAVYASNPYVSIDDVTWQPTLKKDNFDISQFAYFPNPVKDVLNISYADSINTVTICNLLGQEVQVEKINDRTTKVDMSNLANGPYLVRVSFDSFVKTIKVIKE